MANASVLALSKLIRRVSGYRHPTRRVFADFVEMAACALSNRVDLLQYDAREARYEAVRAGYGDEPELQAAFPEMLGHLVNALATPSDVLGRVATELELLNEGCGQYFTPYELCRLQARLIIGGADELRQIIDATGFVTVMEPAIGAGAMVIAFAEQLQELGFEPRRHLHVSGVDIEAQAAHMAYVQLSLLDIPACVTIGNSLTLEVRSRWFTAAHVRGGWTRRLRDYAVTKTPAPAAPTEPKQLGLILV